jgi:hypothetical protein
MNIEDAKLRKVDTRGGKAPHARHLAIINRILVCGFKPKAGERGDILNGEVAATRCGKMLRNFWTADDVSLRDSEGGVYSVECPRCFEGWTEPTKAAVMFRAYTSDSDPGNLYVAKVSDPEIYYRVSRMTARDGDTWQVRPVAPGSAPLRGERLNPAASELTGGVFVALNRYFTSQVAIQ